MLEIPSFYSSGTILERQLTIAIKLSNSNPYSIVAAHPTLLPASQSILLNVLEMRIETDPVCRHLKWNSMNYENDIPESRTS